MEDSRVFKTGAEAEDARDELIEELKGKWCPRTSAGNCVAEKCAVFCNGEISVRVYEGYDLNKKSCTIEEYTIPEVPHCGLIK